MARKERLQLLAGLIDLKPVRSQFFALRIGQRCSRAFHASYHVRVAASRTPVCLQAFLHIHGVGAAQVRRLNTWRWLHREDATMANTVSPDGRGGPRQRKDSLAPAHVQNVHNHIRSFPAEASHYSGSHPKRKRLDSELSIATMYDLYLEIYEPEVYLALAGETVASAKRRRLRAGENIAIAEISGEDESEEGRDANDSDDEQPMPTVSYEQYRTLFHMHGLTFAASPVDACATCMSLQNELNSGSTAADRERAKAALRLHHHEARLAYKMRRFDCQLAQEPASGRLDVPDFLCMDMQAILQTPKV